MGGFTFQKKMDRLLSGSILCMAQELIELQELYRSRKGARAIFPIVSLKCTGHQKQLSSLLREKVERIKAMKGTVRQSVRSASASAFATTRKKSRSA